MQHKSDTLIPSIQKFKGKEIFLQEGTFSTKFLQLLNDSLQLDLKITELEDVTFEDILLKIENGGNPPYGNRQNIAQIAAQYMKHIDYSFNYLPKTLWLGLSRKKRPYWMRKLTIGWAQLKRVEN